MDRMPDNPLKLKKIHHIEFWVGNARQASYFYRKGFGFSQMAYGPGNRRAPATSYVLSQGKAEFHVHDAVGSRPSRERHIRKHGDGVRDIALHVEDADHAFEEAVRRGAQAAEEPHDEGDEHGAIRRAAVHTYGDTIHSLISYKDYSGPFLPGFASAEIPGETLGFCRSITSSVTWSLGRMEEWADFYSRVFGFQRYISFDDKDISTEYSALMSIVMSDDSQLVKFPINEPAPGRKKSQIDEYLEAYRGPGVQHIALLCDDVVKTVGKLQENGVEFLRVPESYYEILRDRVGRIDESLEAIRSLGILVDRDQEGYLLQIFSRPVEDRPTLFFEIIQRKGSRGFGKGNFRALFESIELEQARRGNL